MAIPPSRAVQEIVNKLSSDKAKPREEGIKFLNTCLEGEGSVSFCKYLQRNTAKLKPNEIPHSETWPFLISLLMRCVSEEVSASRRRLPKLFYAKMLRTAVQRADGTGSSLLPVVKSLFNHILDILGSVQSFQSEYGIILRHLLAIRDYQFHIRKRTYSNLVLLYMEKIEESLSGKDDSQYNVKEEVFRCILTLHSLLENPPGDFPDSLREDIVKVFVRISSHIRDEGKVSRKLIECINIYLLKDGPNLGSQSLEIHDAVQQFIFRCWQTTHDKGLKDALIIYARLQISLTRDSMDGGPLVEQFLDVVCKELDESNVSTSVVPRNDMGKDDKFGSLSSSQCGLVELAAMVFYRACIHTANAQLSVKRVKKEHAAALLKDALMKGKYLWNAAFCCLIQNYGDHIRKDLLIYWFNGICSSFERTMNDATMGHAYDGLLWTIRSLQELSFKSLDPNSTVENSSRLSVNVDEHNNHWQLIWSCLMHGLLIFSNVTVVADAALKLIGNMILNELTSASAVPRDIWDLQLFRGTPSVSLLYFVSCYFSRRGSQGNLQEMLNLRKNLLRTLLHHLSWKESSVLNEDTVLVFPSALYALCAGCAPFTHRYKEDPLSYSFVDASEAVVKRDDFFDCSVEVLAKTEIRTKKVSTFERPTTVHLPRQFMDMMLQEMETHLLRLPSDLETEKLTLSNSFYICAVISNFIYGSYVARQSEEASSFVSKICEHLSQLLDSVIIVIQENCNGLHSQGSLGDDSIFEGINNIFISFRSLSRSRLFVKWQDQNVSGDLQYNAVIQSMERLLKALVELYEQVSHFSRDPQFLSIPEDSSSLDPSTGSANSLGRDKSIIMDIDLDVKNVSKDSNIMSIGGKLITTTSFSLENWKISMISLISSFFSIVHDVTWDTLFDLMEKECDTELRGYFLYDLCKNPYRGSSTKIVSLVTVMKNMLKVHGNLKRDCFHIVAAMNALLKTLMETDKRHNFAGQPVNERELEKILADLGDQMNKGAELDLLKWFGRVKLIDGICDLIKLNPQIGQAMIDRLLIMVQDSDYRVRLFLARHIGILFQTWNGHEGLFQDILSSFGVVLVVKSKDKLVSAREVIATGPQPRPAMETAIITLMNLALESEKVELEAVFIMCVTSAIEPSLRELVSTVLDNLSRQLDYANRQKYLEQLIGTILFCWVSCGVSLAALVEIRHIFVLDAEPCYFVQYCCQWLLPALILQDDKSSLSWVSKISGQPLAFLIRNYFVPIFSVFMVLYSGNGSEQGKAAVALQTSILYHAEISENERDKLIKKHMVAIVSHIFSLASCSSESSAPYMPKDIVASAIRTVVDGFLEMKDSPEATCIIDQISIFRPDRVFTFILEMHYHIAAAVHHRHKCHRLAGIEILVNILGHRAAAASTSNYLFNVIGQSIDYPALQEQCCCIISLLLETFRSNPSKEIFNVLGEQLQFLVSKVVACCISCDANGVYDNPILSQAVSLLRQLTVDSDPYLHDYVLDLEPFPDTDMFAEVRRFHLELCHSYCARQHLLKFVKRSSYLPPRLLLSSLQALHKKLLVGVTVQSDNCEDDNVGSTIWNGDHEILHAVWTLVRMCGSESLCKARVLVSDFVSKIGIGDPHCVVFHLPEDLSHMHVSRTIECNKETNTSISGDTGISEELMVSLLKFLKKYLMDDSVKIVDITLQALRGILSTEKGQRALKSFDSYGRSLIEVHSRGVNIELVEKFILDLERKSDAEALPMDKPILWETHGKSFETWICPLVYSLIGYCNDVILRLCQDVVSLKSEIAEFLLPSVLVNLAGRKDLDFNLQKLISLQVQEHIFTESNLLIRSIQVWLNALNELRLCHVVENSSSIPSKRENLKVARSSSYGSKSRSSSSKSKESVATSHALSTSTSTSLWDKVYWLSVDYLVVARSAIKCGSYFTSVLYVEHWSEEHFNRLTLGSPDFSDLEMLPPHIEILVAAVTHINEPDSLYGIIQSYKHEGNWSKALEYYDLQVRLEALQQLHGGSGNSSLGYSQSTHIPTLEGETSRRKPYKGLVRSLQQTGCTHVLDLYCQGLTSREGEFQYDQEFTELQYEAAWRAGNWDFCVFHGGAPSIPIDQPRNSCHFNENLHSCLRALQEGHCEEFYRKLKDSKKELIWSVTCASEERTEYIYATIIRLQILSHLTMAWDLRWKEFHEGNKLSSTRQKVIFKTEVPTVDQLSLLDREWNSILKRTQLHINLLEPFVAFRRVLLQILNCKDYTVQHLLQSATTLRKGSRFSQAAAALHEFKCLSVGNGENYSSLYWMGRIEEAKLLRAQGQHEMAINLAKYISNNSQVTGDASDVYRLVGKWLAEIRSSNSNTILENYLKPAVALAQNHKASEKKSVERQSQAHFHLAHYADALFRSYEDRLTSNEWQAAMRLRKHKTTELEALVKRLRSSTKGEKTDYAAKIQELQKQLAMDKEEAEKLQEDRDNFLSLALDGYKHCLVVGDKHDARVVFRLISLWFSLSSRQNVINSMISTINEVQSYKFVPLVYQIASRMGSSKDGHIPNNFQFALVSLVKKMAVDHPYHTIFQLLALANGDRIKDKQRSRNSFVVDMDKKLAAGNLLEELSSYHGPIIRQMKQMVDVYIKLAELETRREDTNRRVALPRDIRGLRQLELVPVVTATFPIDRSCQYPEGSFPYFNGLSDSIVVMNGINAPKVVECLGSDGRKYRQLAKSGNDDLRQDAVMEQFFGFVNTFLQNHRDTWKRRLNIRTYKVVPFTPSAGVLEWVDGTVPLGEYLIGSTRSGGAHGRYGIGDWSFHKCRDHMANEKDKRMAFQEVCKKYRPVMHHFFLERFPQPADWFEKRLAYTRSVAASSMVGYIVGLGDRHSMNILIDQATAEVVHIDLGVAFEQGLMLKTPERVPFRLTRDIIDGMGATGVEGVFRRCCEETLSVMRMNKEALLTIVEVFIHDPLYKWALSPLKALQRQKETDYDLETSLDGSECEMEGNKDAARALMRVKQKLDGYDGGEMRSVHGQVQKLIQDAIDPERLCQMFPGWGAWL